MPWKKRPSSTSFWARRRIISCRPICRWSPPMRGPSFRKRSQPVSWPRAYVVDDKPSPWLPVWQASIRAVTTLARMLALSPGGRVPSKSAEAQEPVSYYSRLALEAKRR